MKYIFANLKRFDIPKEMDGINGLAPVNKWGSCLTKQIRETMNQYGDQAEIAVFYPEAYLLQAAEAKGAEDKWKIGVQGVYRKDTERGGNFGAFTTNRTAKSVKSMGCEYVLIGHCEERMDKAGVLAEAGVVDPGAVNRILNEEISCAVKAGLSVLYCVGETEEEQDRWQEVIGQQLDVGLGQVELSRVAVAYEPLWAIGPGKPVPDADHITKVAKFIKSRTGGCPVIYGGGLKEENARMLAEIPCVDGGLIGLTKFSGDIGFYPEGFAVIVEKYLGEGKGEDKGEGERV